LAIAELIERHIETGGRTGGTLVSTGATVKQCRARCSRIAVPISARGTIGDCAKVSAGNQRAEGLEPNSAASARARSRWNVRRCIPFGLWWLSAAFGLTGAI
jgi:hypothetical protein